MFSELEPRAILAQESVHFETRIQPRIGVQGFFSIEIWVPHPRHVFVARVGSGQNHAAVCSRRRPESLFQALRRTERIRSSPTSFRTSATRGERLATLKRWPACWALA